MYNMENNNFNKGGYVNNKPNFNENAPKINSDVCVTPKSTSYIDGIGGWKNVGKAVGTGAAVAAGGYLLYRGIKWGWKKITGKKHSKEEAPATTTAGSKKEEQFEEAK